MALPFIWTNLNLLSKDDLKQIEIVIVALKKKIF